MRDSGCETLRYSKGVKNRATPTIRDQILNALAASNAGITESVLLDSVRGRRQEKVKVLRALVESGDVSRTGSGKRGDPYSYELLKTHSPNQASAEITTITAQRTSELVDNTSPSLPLPLPLPECSTLPEAYKTYTRPDGTTYTVTKEEFERTVQRFRLLLVKAKSAAKKTPTGEVV